MRSIWTLILAMTIGIYTSAHEGHDKIPSNLNPPNGGQLKATSEMYIELVSESSGIKLFVYDHDLKPIPLKDVKIEGSFTLPKQKAGKKLVFNNESKYFESRVDARGSHRFNVKLQINHKGRTSDLAFTVEPQ